MKKINKVILGVAGSLILSGSLSGVSSANNTSKGYSSNKTEIAVNYQDQDVFLAQNITVFPTAKPSAKPTVTPSPKPSAKPTPTPSPKITPKPTAKPSAKATVSPSPKVSPKVSAKPSAKPSPKATPSPKGVASSVVSGFGNILSGIGRFFGGLFGR